MSPELRAAEKALKEAEYLVRRLRNKECKRAGHTKGYGAFEGYSYCRVCHSQIANTEFRK